MNKCILASFEVPEVKKVKRRLQFENMECFISKTASARLEVEGKNLKLVNWKHDRELKSFSNISLYSCDYK